MHSINKRMVDVHSAMHVSINPAERLVHGSQHRDAEHMVGGSGGSREHPAPLRNPSTGAFQTSFYFVWMTIKSTNDRLCTVLPFEDQSKFLVWTE